MIYERYTCLVCDALAVSGLTIASKEAQAILDKSSTNFTQLVVEEKRKTASELFSYLLLRPVERLHEYVKFLAAMKADDSRYYSPFTLDKLKVAHTHWKQLSNTAHKNQVNLHYIPQLYNIHTIYFENRTLVLGLL